MAGDYPVRNPFSSSDWFINAGPTNQFADTTGIDPKLLERIERIDRNMEKILERLAILDEPSPTKLAKHKTLKEAYMKYLFLEKLCGEEVES